jgi:hypothetical protein
VKTYYFTIRCKTWRVPWSAIRVVLFDSKKPMLEYLRKEAGDNFPTEAVATCLCFGKETFLRIVSGNRKVKRRLYSELVFYKGKDLDEGVVAHEAVHAALHIFREVHPGKKLNVKPKQHVIPRDSVEELFCMLVEAIVHEVSECLVTMKGKDKMANRDKEMIDGVATLIRKVKSKPNRKEIAQYALRDFKKEKVVVDPDKFMKRVGL